MDTYQTAEQYALRMIRIAAAEQTDADGESDPDTPAAMDQISQLAEELTTRLDAGGLICLMTALARHAGYGYTLAAVRQGVTVEELIDRMAVTALEE